MKAWITDCVKNHPRCRNELQSFVPTRLLDIKAFENSDDIRLVTLGLSLPPTRFVALSHCWGPSMKLPITTTTSTLGKRMERIKFSHLSQTFQDAVTLTRQLGQSYLWIDSLCIIQDNKEDWAIEAAAMAAVYGNSIFTIFALSSKNSDGGCRVNAHSKSPIKASRYCDINTGAGRIRLFESAPQQWHIEYGDNTYKHGRYSTDNPLRTRAWTLQERELSVRGIHFSANMVLWECRTLKSSSEIPWESLEPPDDFLPWPIRNNPDESIEAGGPVLLRERWYELVEDFSSRSLSYETDKLPALSGLASTFAESFSQSPYLGGLWRSHMPSSLLWKTTLESEPSLYSAFQPRRPMSYRAPSWSWASVDSLISYGSQRLSNTGGLRPEEGIGSYNNGLFEIVDSEIQLATDGKFGAISAASLQLRGCILPMQFRYEKYGNDFTYDDGMRAVIGEDGSTVGALYPDIITEVRDMKWVYCLSIKGESFFAEDQVPYGLYKRNFHTEDEILGENAMIMGLALMKDTSKSNTYRRVGLIRWMKKSLFSGIAPSLFTFL
jgi:hypothetical protein